ncbi:MAG: hypothetical protein ACRDRJ_48830 [Streptosporangiaceae bacterium]
MLSARPDAIALEACNPRHEHEWAVFEDVKLPPGKTLIPMAEGARLAREFPPVVNLRPEGDHPDRAHVVADLPRVAAILQRIAADVDELARARPRGRPRRGGCRP